MIKIAITGSTGLIGSRIVELLKNDFEFIPLIYPRLDITSRENVADALKEIEFDLFLHLAAYTNVDGAEKEKKTAYKINVTGTKNVFEAVKSKEKSFIYISTGFVFDGTKPPYYEDSKPNPIGYYGETKYEGEKVVGKEGMIVRTEYPYRATFEHKKDFVRTIKSILEEGKPIKAVEDMIITPTFIDDIAYALKHLMHNYSNGIYHIVGADSLSPFRAATLIAKTFNLDETLVQPTTLEEYFKGKVKRPKYAEIKTKKNNFAPMKTFEQGLKFIYNS